MKVANGLVLDFTVDNADTAADTFLGLNANGEVTKFASVPRARVSGGGNITEATSSVLSITGGTAAVLTSGLTIQVLQAGAAQSGYLSTTDWNTFNNKLSGSLTSANIYVGNGSNVATGVAVSGDITMSNAGVVAIASGVIVNADINASAAIAVSKLAAVTASRVLGSDGSGFIQALDTATYPSLTELAYGKGVTSAIQTQLNNRLSVTLTSPTNGDVITYNGAAWVNSPSSTGVPTGGTTAQILRKIDNTNYNTEWHTLVAADITDVSSTAAELNLLDGVTTTTAQFNFLNTVSGDVQSQLDAKLASSLTLNNIWVGNVSNIPTQLAAGTNGYVLTSVSGVPTWVSPGVGGTVTSVAASGGTTGMSFTGSPITTSGTLTLTGTLAIANGGSGLTSLGTANQLLRVNAGATALEYFTPSYLTALSNGNGTTANGSAVDLGGVINGSLYSGTEIYPDTNNEQNFSIGKNGNAFNQIQFYSGDNGYQMFNNGAATSFTDFGYDGLGGTFSPYNFNVYFNNRLRLKSLSGIIFDFDQTGIKLDLGSDATGDIYYRNSSGYLTRLAAGSNTHVLTLAGGVPTWAAPSGGGIGGSTGATDNSILRADGTGGATLQNSGLFIDDSANLTIGTVSLSGNKTISAVNSTSDANLTLTSQGTVVVDVASSAESFQVMTTNDRVIINPAGFQLFGEKINASANATFLVSGAQGITGATTGQNLLLQAGSGYATGVTNGGHLYLMYGAKNTTGLDGNIGLLTNSVANWQSMERGVYLANRLTAPTAGIANGVSLFAEDSNSSSEFYVMPESGAKVNISGLFEPVTESGTSFTLNETHRNKIVLCSNSGVVTVTVGTGKAAGWNCMLVATHATGTITLSTSGTTINGTTSTTTQFETLSLVHYGSENYLSKLG